MLVLRRIIMICGLCAFVGAWATRAAHAEFEQALLDRSVGLFELARHWVRSEPRTLVMNGARIILTTARSEQPVSVLLDHFQANCRRRSGGLHQAVRRAFASTRELPSLVDGVLRVEQDGQGMVACFDFGERELAPSEWLSRVERFVSTADLAELGQFKLVRAQSEGTGAFLVAVWNDGPVPLARMFPKDGDAPGVDSPRIPRPRGARRVFSVWQEGAASALNLYARPGAAGEGFESYVHTLGENGWEVAQESALQSQSGPHATLLFQDGHSAFIHAQTRGAETLISVFDMDSGPGLARAVP